MLKKDVAIYRDEYTDLHDDFETVNGVFRAHSGGRITGFAIRIREAALCALRLKQQVQAPTALPMCRNLISLLDEVQSGEKCSCEIHGQAPHHVDMFDESPSDDTNSLDAFREHCYRQRFLRVMHEQGFN